MTKPLALLICIGLLASCTPDSGSQTIPDLGGLPSHCSVIDPADKRFVACSGTFQEGTASTLCPSGYTLQAPPLPGALRAACENFRNKQHFFAADVPAWNDPLAPFSSTSCSRVAGWLPGLMGCGGSANATANPGCQGWPTELICSKTPQTWDCRGSGLANANNKDSEGGVVCFGADS